MSGLRFARGSAKGGKLMQDCCLTCKHLEYRKNYIYPYVCAKCARIRDALDWPNGYES